MLVCVMSNMRLTEALAGKNDFAVIPQLEVTLAGQDRHDTITEESLADIRQRAERLARLNATAPLLILKFSKSDYPPPDQVLEAIDNLLNEPLFRPVPFQLLLET